MRKPQFIARLEKRARRDRHLLFVELLSKIERPLKILDVGGVYDYWQHIDVASLGDVRFVLLNLFPQDELPSSFSAELGDARELSRYADQEFDVVFSNSVLGHVGGFADQMRMAREIRRVGMRYLVQHSKSRLPHRLADPVPCFHFLPVRMQAWCFRQCSVGTYRRVTDRDSSLELASCIRNIRKSELSLLFPNSVVLCERYLGMTKSFMIHSGFS